MDAPDRDWLAGRFEAHRPRLRAVAQRLLGATAEADDAVQEAWLRLTRTDPASLDNLGGWLTTVVARVCLNQLRARRSHPEAPLDAEAAERPAAELGPEDQALVADAVGPAMLVVLDTLAPAERVAFVLHDLFAVPFTEIGPLVGRSPVAARQLASRARRRVQGQAPDPGVDRGRQRALVEAFLAASREGDFQGLLALLDPEVVVHADPAAVAVGADAEVRGAEAVAGTFAGRARAARLALVEGAAGLVWAQGGRPRMAFAFTVADGRITEIRLLADPERLARVELALDPGG
jgi:RNA polymerase sigma-70 factor (ECF subfamily)